jgi:hypothetical protein
MIATKKVRTYENLRRLKILFNYRFGKNEFKTRSERSTTSNKEQSRNSK